MPTRILRDGILESERVDALSVEAELFYRRLMSRADDYGRYTADPVLLRSNLYPRRVDRISLAEVESWLAECSAGEDPLVIVYQVFGKRYLEIVNFGQRLRTESKFPPKPENPPDSSNVREMRQSAATCGNPPQPAAECGSTRAQGRTESETKAETKASAPRFLDPSAEKTLNGEPLTDIALRLRERHPKKSGRELIEFALEKFRLRHGEGADAEFAKLDEAHAAQSRSRDWTKENAKYCPKLCEWIDDDRYQEYQSRASPDSDSDFDPRRIWSTLGKESRPSK